MINLDDLYNKVVHIVYDVFETKPSLIYLDILKYIEPYYNPKIKIYVVYDAESIPELDETIHFDGMKVHLKGITKTALLSTRRYLTSYAFAYYRNAIAYINGNKKYLEISDEVFKNLLFIDILDELYSKVDKTCNYLKKQKEFDAENKYLVAKCYKYSIFFHQFVMLKNITKAYEKTLELIEDKVVESLVLNKPMLVQVVSNEIENNYEQNQFEKLKENLGNLRDNMKRVLDSLTKE